ncbi:MAG: 3-oxoacyl-ACP reductase family protein [Candidatus Methylacidiphilales bacterium]|nr:3-oxoacyl-ACP reductase family protein [Candidatus Methylacidiphilales bacterium]
MSTLPLSGKKALVTGASRGIGAAIAKRLAADGASVAITYSSSAGKADEVVAEITAAGGKAVALKADSAEAEAVIGAVKDTVAKLGGIDILVNNAGIAAMATPEEFKLEDFDRQLAINVRAVWIGTQEALRHMGKGGRIITIGSTMGDRSGFANSGPYSMTKSAVAGLTRGLAHDLGPRGITINTVQPGPIATDMNPADGPQAEFMHSMLAIKRHGKGSEVASLVAYLCTEDAAFITGASLNVDGGFAA